MDETVKQVKKSVRVSRFRPQTQSFSDFGRFDRTLYQTDRKRSYTFTDSSSSLEKPVLERVRNFSKTKRGIKNHGDFLRISSTTFCSNTDIECQGSQISVFPSSSFSSDDFIPQKDNKGYKVIIFGIPGVGKSFLLQQMRTSEFLGTCPEGPDPFYQSVPVVLGKRESVLNFVEADMYIQNHGNTNEYDGFVMMYSVTDKRSFNFIANKLKKIKEEVGDSKPVYVVANKVDLIRFREVSSKDGLSLAQENNCSFVEVSVSLQWNIDKVLVDVTEQLQGGKKKNNGRKISKFDCRSNPKTPEAPSIQPMSEGKSHKKRSILSRLRKFFKRKHLKF
ncbi:GTP-binding protein Rit1-like [Saccostrea echinata]|uniref:GTP-binding protein Rit1-like n=1 Tax=Saccostrea echinata TaxID=191078 RepID=UPI002A832BA3|nr:GTP-binding protein Rit1-like [Saccostrea echinata]